MTDGEHSNVVQMGRYAKSPSGLSPQQLEGILAECRDKVAARLASVVGAFMPRVDDALFDLADKAVGIGRQNLYFDAMREVRRKRPDIESGFLAAFHRDYDATARGEGPSTPEGAADQPLGLELSLVDNDELEEDLAVGNAAAKISAACQEDLLVLEQRMAVLLDEPELASDQNPLAPKLICNAFKGATEQLECETEIKLIIFKLFERAVSPEMKGVYEEANQYLAKMGVLARVQRPAAPRAAPSRTSPQPPPEPAQSPVDAAPVEAAAGGDGAGPDATGGYPPSLVARAPTSGDLLSLLQQLVGVEVPVSGGGAVGTGRPSAAASEPQPASMPVPGVSPAVPAGLPAEESAEVSSGTSPAAALDASVLRKLTFLQRGQPAAAREQTAELDAASLRAGNVNVLRELRSTEFANSMSVVDVMTLDVVTMLFDFILDDSNVPDAMKALIGRLQIPVLKVAMMDGSVFSKRTHPVRRLLDTLARLAIGWNEDQGQEDPLYRTVERVVAQVADRFEDDISIFTDLLSELEEFAAQQQAEAALGAGESAERVEDRERLSESRHRATAAVEVGLAGNEVPPAIEEFLRQCWRDMLAFTYLEEGIDGPEWQSAIETMDDLVWSVAPKAGAEEQQRLVNMLPDLLKYLKEGMSRAGITKEQAKGFLSTLATLHAAAVHDDMGRGSASTEREAEPASVSSIDASSEAAMDDRAASVIRQAFERANKAIFEVARTRSDCAGMGTTLVCASFSDDSVTIAHVGDSRLYRLREGQLAQLTVDHSLLERLVAQGFYTREEAKQSNNKNYVTRAMGIAADEKVDVHREGVLAGDIYLLCSDGLSDLVEPEVMQATLAEPGVDLEALAAYLVKLANDAGGKDNISVVLVRVLQSFSGQHSGVRNLEGKLEIVAVTNVGRKRSHNEDSVGFDPALGVALLADGMGGYNAGEVASALAVNMMLEELREGLGAASAASAQSGKAKPGSQAGESVESGIEEIILEGMAAEGSAEDVNDGFTEMAAGLDIGNWVEFRQDGDSVRRARLTWISPTSGVLLFTDRQGLKVAEATSHGLAVEFRRGSAAPLEDVPLFDRAVGGLMSRLKGSIPASGLSQN